MIIRVAVALIPCFCTTCGVCPILPPVDVSANRKELWIKELVLDLRNGQV